MPDLEIIIVILGAVSAFVLTVSCIPAQSPLSRTLQALESRGTTGSNALERTGKIERFVTRALPQEQLSSLSQKLLEAGWYTVTPTQIVLRIVAAVLIAFIVFLVYVRYIHLGLPTFVSVLLLFAVLAYIIYSPIAMLNRAMERRKDQVQRALPDFLDMVATTVQAGLSVNAALAYAIDAAPGALGNELKEVLAEVRLGRSRAEALKAAADRLNQQEFTTTIAAITQAERLGANIGKILSELADDTRTHRIIMVEEHAHKLPVKMVFPMAFFLLPALFVIIFGSLVVNYLSQHG